MASLVWTSVFLFLCLELVLTLILVVPVPRKIRNYLAKEIFQFHLGDRLSKPILFIGIALGMALIESYITHQRIMDRIAEDAEAGYVSGAMGNMAAYATPHAHHHFHDKERKYKSERNMYLAGFALTLLFVIGRITTLMQESVELEAECDRIQKFVKDSTKNTNDKSSQKQPTDKKKD